MQMSALDHELREKWQRKSQRVETENLIITQALSSKTDKPTANPIYLQDSYHSECSAVLFSFFFVKFRTLVF